MRNRRFSTLYISIPLLVITGIISLLTSVSEGFAAFMRSIGLTTGMIAGNISGILPFALSEFLLVGTVLFVVIYIIRTVVKSRWRGVLKCLRMLLLTASIVLFIFMLNFGVQYSAPSAAEFFGISIDNSYEVEDLAELMDYLLGNANRHAEAMQRDIDGDILPYNYSDMVDEILATYKEMNYEILNIRYSSPPKRSLLLTEFMSMVGISGYYFPFTGEAVVCRNYVRSHMPFTVAHEAAHSMGIGSESEANFIAYLVCINSDSPLVQYAGELCAYVYVSNSLYKANPELQQQIRSSMNDYVRHDIANLNDYVAKYADTWASNIGSKVNNNYIKATGQADGIVAYSRIVELVLDYYVKFIRQV